MVPDLPSGARRGAALEDLPRATRGGVHLQGARGVSGPCAKQRVIAEIVTPDGARFYGENLCDRPQEVCPRAGMATGVGYHLCSEVCGLTGHAEINALAEAGARAKGATLVLHGHSYACDHCKAVAEQVGIVEIQISGLKI
jgi:deoxycytidylate deaminase